MKTTIKVTASHIREGKQRDCERCPIALALSERFGIPTEFLAVGVQTVTILVRKGDKTFWAVGEKLGELPREAQQFIMTFDAKGLGSVAPFNFDFDFNERILEKSKNIT